NVQGFNVQGFNVQGFNVQGVELLGIDRLRGLASSMEYRGLQYADTQAPAANLQGQQANTPVNYVTIANPMSGVRLQARPGTSSPDILSGSYISVRGLSGTTKDIQGTLWNMVLADSTGATAAIGLYIADVAKDTAKNVSKYPSND